MPFQTLRPPPPSTIDKTWPDSQAHHPHTLNSAVAALGFPKSYLVADRPDSLVAVAALQ